MLWAGIILSRYLLWQQLLIRERFAKRISSMFLERDYRTMNRDDELDLIDIDYVEDWDSRDNRRRQSSGTGARRPGNSAGRSGNSTRRPEAGAGRPGNSARRPEAGAGRPRNSARRPEAGAGRPGNSARRPNSSAGRPAGNSVRSSGTPGRDRAEYSRNRDRERVNEWEEDAYERRQVPKKKRKKKKKKSGVKKFLLTLLILFILLAAGFFYLVNFAYGKMKYEEIPSVAKESMQDEGVVNILLIGNDSRSNGEDGRSDAMILLSISKKTKTIYMTSLLRDMYVEIPGHDDNRLNAAYSFGGAELLMETVEKNLNIDVNRYILVNFEAFANLVDAVNGVDLELTNQEVEYVNGYLVEYNMLLDRPQGTDNLDPSLSGMVHLNGAQALAYSRNRYLGTDFGRTDRQRKVLTAVIKKLPGAIVTKPGELIDGLMPNLTTNLTKTECYRLGLMAGKIFTYDIVQSSIPQEGTYKDATIRGMAVLEVDFDANRRFIQENIYGKE